MCMDVSYGCTNYVLITGVCVYVYLYVSIGVCVYGCVNHWCMCVWM